MSKKELFKAINKKCLEFNNKYDINSGGCCYIAAVLSELLSKYNIPHSLIYYDNFGVHYAIKVCDRYLNRDTCTKADICEITEDPDYEEIYYIYYHNDWNWIYDIRYNGTIKASLIRIFDKYGKGRNHRKIK